MSNGKNSAINTFQSTYTWIEHHEVRNYQLQSYMRLIIKVFKIQHLFYAQFLGLWARESKEMQKLGEGKVIHPKERRNTLQAYGGGLVTKSRPALLQPHGL